MASDHPRNGADAALATDMPSGFALIPHQLIVPDLLNPRKDFGEGLSGGDDNEDEGGFDQDAADDEGDLETLAASIAARGLLQNLVVRPAAPMEGYGQPMHRLVAGERRWRAIDRLIRRGDWPADRPVPCRVVDMDDAGHAVIALLENLQRKKLKPLEEARAFRRLIDDFGMKTAEIADKINFRQRVVQQRLQLLTLDAEDQADLDAGVISVEEARRLAAQPKTAPETVTLTEGEVFLMAELVHNWKHAPKRKNSYYHETECRFGVADPALDRLKQLRFVDITTDTFTTEKTYIRRGYRWPDKIELPEIPEGTAIYRTSWLNGPFPIPAEGLKRLADKKARKTQERDEAKKAKEKAAKLAREVDWLLNQPLPLSAEAQAAFADQFKRAGSGWPWTLVGDGVKAEGLSYGVGLNLYGLNPALTRLLTFAVNAAGADQTQGRPPTVACNHVLGVSLNDLLILRALFDMVSPGMIPGLAEAAGASEEDVTALKAKIAGDDWFGAAEAPAAAKQLAGAAE